ncbi:MAG: orotidine-5'-phosphate decarboxylase [Chloroflexota bacterium]|nr:orotidine-5'-phosphate decarboxylase [Chloroflexota bacterium]MDE2931712.1 orotidine-5'-phosphate decarboxylase [Chloroflexota bacterium]
MSFNARLRQTCAKKNSALCIGLDVDLARLPTGIPATREGVVHFCREIIEATHQFAAAYKPNVAFFESMGMWGLEALEEVRGQIPADVVTIADAKRGDIDSTNVHYAVAVFDVLGFDAVTAHPYLGAESLEPFLSRPDRGVFVLCRTSNPGARDFQDLRNETGERLYITVAKAVQSWNVNDNCGLVTGATYPEELAEVRQVAPYLPLLIPGIGAQGGDLPATVQAAGTAAPMLINASRSILYASNENDFAEAAATAATKLHTDINQALAIAT